MMKSKNPIKDFLINYKDTKDVITSDFNINKNKYKIIYQETLSNISLFNKEFIPLMHKIKSSDLDKVFPGTFTKNNNINYNNLEKQLFEGSLILYDVIKKDIYIIFLEAIPKRNVEDTLGSSASLTGSRDGFIESSKTNIGLIRNRIKSDKLCNKQFTIGRYSKTQVNLVYVDDIVDSNFIKKITKHLQNIDIDAISSIHSIKEQFSNNSLFPIVSYTGKTDQAASALMTGRCIIFVDNFPLVIILPVNITYFLSLADEISTPKYFSILSKSLSLITLLTSIYFLGFIVAMILFHQKNISILFLASIRFNREGIPFPFAIEAFLILIIFEIYLYTANKSPQLLTQSVMLIVGGVIIGQATVVSGFASVISMVIVAIPFVSSFVVANNALFLSSISIQRIFILILSSMFGLFGFFFGMMILFGYAYNTKSLGQAYLSPFAPFNLKDIIRYFIPRNVNIIGKRPEFLNTKNKTYRRKKK